MIMPDGWHYEQDGFTIRGQDSIEDLYKNVTDWRIQNKKPVGDVIKDVDEWICAKYPRQCNVVNPNFGDGGVIVNDTQAYLDSITQWAHIKSKINGKLVDQGLAAQRALICEQCINNKIWSKTGCKSCIANMERLMISIRQNKDTPQGADLGGCSMLKHDNRTAVWLEENNTTDNLPGHCWCRK